MTTAQSSPLPEFHLPSFTESPNGWGPSAQSLPAHLIGLPFMPFNKAEKLTRISDWLYPRDGSRSGRTVDEEEIVVDDEGGAFSLVDNKPKTNKPRFGNFRPNYQQQRRSYQQQGAQGQGQRGRQTGQSAQQPQKQAAPTAAAAAKPSQSGQGWSGLATGGGWSQSASKGKISTGSMGGGRASQQQGNRGHHHHQRRWGYDVKEKEFSVKIQEDWKLVNDIELSELAGVTFEPLGSEELMMAGELKPYNLQYNRVTPRTAVTLNRYDNRQFFTASTSEDPILTKLIEEHAGTVFATDSILSLLMSASRSIHGWDLILKKQNGQLIFDKRSDSKIDYLSVNENAADQSLSALLDEEADSVNHPTQLSLEATVINHNFSQQVLTNSAEQSLKFDQENPFLQSLALGQEPASVAYRYASFNLGNDLELIARASVNAYTQKTGDSSPSLILTRVLNEFDPRLSGSVDWRQKLESQTGAILAIEMKNNSFRLARYVSESLIAEADEVKVGFVTRFNSKSAAKHQLLMTKHYTTQTLAESVNIRVKTLWGSLKVLLEKLNALSDGEFLLVRNPNKPTLHIYRVPDNAFGSSAGAASGAAEATEE